MNYNNYCDSHIPNLLDVVDESWASQVADNNSLIVLRDSITIAVNCHGQIAFRRKVRGLDCDKKYQ